MSALLKIEIQNAKVDERSGKRDDGTRWSIRTQKSYWHCGDAYPVPANLPLAEDQQPYAPGHYTLAAESFVLGKYSMELGRRVVLVPLASSQASQSKAA